MEFSFRFLDCFWLSGFPCFFSLLYCFHVVVFRVSVVGSYAGRWIAGKFITDDGTELPDVVPVGGFVLVPSFSPFFFISFVF